MRFAKIFIIIFMSILFLIGCNSQNKRPEESVSESLEPYSDESVDEFEDDTNSVNISQKVIFEMKTEKIEFKTSSGILVYVNNIEDLVEWNQETFLPFYDDIDTEVTWNQNGYVSLLEVYHMWKVH